MERRHHIDKRPRDMLLREIWDEFKPETANKKLLPFTKSTPPASSTLLHASSDIVTTQVSIQSGGRIAAIENQRSAHAQNESSFDMSSSVTTAMTSLPSMITSSRQTGNDVTKLNSSNTTVNINDMYINTNVEQNAASDAFKMVHMSRIENIRNACRDESLFANQIYKGAYSLRYYKSNIYNFAYCKVPKGGSTFWTQVFGVLKYGVDYGERVFSVKRSEVHNGMSQYMAYFEKIKRDKSRAILVSRDPYTRLYSAFIDKSYVPLMTRINFEIRNVSIGEMSTTCPFDVSFQEFLDWVVDRGSRGTLNRHWAPIISLCRPCEMNAFILVKLESFSKDVEFALRQVGVTGPKYEYIVSALHGHRIEVTLPGIIKTIYSPATVNSSVRKCLGYEGLAEKIWRSFQIQGFIDKVIDFPKHVFTQDGRHSISNVTYFTEVVLNTVQKHTLNSTQSKLQRQDFLLQAYEDIHPDTIKGIQLLFKQDFEIFGYSKQPPSRTQTKA